MPRVSLLDVRLVGRVWGECAKSDLGPAKDSEARDSRTPRIRHIEFPTPEHLQHLAQGFRKRHDHLSEQLTQLCVLGRASGVRPAPSGTSAPAVHGTSLFRGRSRLRVMALAAFATIADTKSQGILGTLAHAQAA